MDTFFTGFIFGIIVSISGYIFLWAVRRGKKDSSDSLKARIDRNNISTERGLGILRTNNRESGRIIDEGQEIASKGLKSIKDTNRTVSEIIAAASRAGKEKSEG